MPSSPFSADVSSILEQSHESPLGPRGPARALGHGGARGAPPTGGTRGAPPNTRAAAGPAAALHARAPVEGASQGAGTLPGARGHSANQLLSVTRSPVGPSERVGGDQGHGPGHPGGRAGRDISVLMTRGGVVANRLTTGLSSLWGMMRDAATPVRGRQRAPPEPTVTSVRISSPDSDASGWRGAHANVVGAHASVARSLSRLSAITDNVIEGGGEEVSHCYRAHTSSSPHVAAVTAALTATVGSPTGPAMPGTGPGPGGLTGGKAVPWGNELKVVRPSRADARDTVTGPSQTASPKRVLPGGGGAPPLSLLCLSSDVSATRPSSLHSASHSPPVPPVSAADAAKSLPGHSLQNIGAETRVGGLTTENPLPGTQQAAGAPLALRGGLEGSHAVRGGPGSGGGLPSSFIPGLTTRSSLVDARAVPSSTAHGTAVPLTTWTPSPPDMGRSPTKEAPTTSMPVALGHGNPGGGGKPGGDAGTDTRAHLDDSRPVDVQPHTDPNPHGLTKSCATAVADSAGAQTLEDVRERVEVEKSLFRRIGSDVMEPSHERVSSMADPVYPSLGPRTPVVFQNHSPQGLSRCHRAPLPFLVNDNPAGNAGSGDNDSAGGAGGQDQLLGAWGQPGGDSRSESDSVEQSRHGIPEGEELYYSATRHVAGASSPSSQQGTKAGRGAEYDGAYGGEYGAAAAGGPHYKPQPFGDFGRVFSAPAQDPSQSMKFDFDAELEHGLEGEPRHIPDGMEALGRIGRLHERGLAPRLGGGEASMERGSKCHERAEYPVSDLDPRIVRAVEEAQHETWSRHGGTGYSDIEDFEVQRNQIVAYLTDSGYSFEDATAAVEGTSLTATNPAAVEAGWQHAERLLAGHAANKAAVLREWCAEELLAADFTPAQVDGAMLRLRPEPSPQLTLESNRRHRLYAEAHDLADIEKLMSERWICETTGHGPRYEYAKWRLSLASPEQCEYIEARFRQELQESMDESEFLRGAAAEAEAARVVQGAGRTFQRLPTAPLSAMPFYTAMRTRAHETTSTRASATEALRRDMERHGRLSDTPSGTMPLSTTMPSSSRLGVTSFITGGDDDGYTRYGTEGAWTMHNNSVLSNDVSRSYRTRAACQTEARRLQHGFAAAAAQRVEAGPPASRFQPPLMVPPPGAQPRWTMSGDAVNVGEAYLPHDGTATRTPARLPDGDVGGCGARDRESKCVECGASIIEGGERPHVCDHLREEVCPRCGWRQTRGNAALHPHTRDDCDYRTAYMRHGESLGATPGRTPPPELTPPPARLLTDGPGVGAAAHIGARRGATTRSMAQRSMAAGAGGGGGGAPPLHHRQVLPPAHTVGDAARSLAQSPKRATTRHGKVTGWKTRGAVAVAETIPPSHRKHPIYPPRPPTMTENYHQVNADTATGRTPRRVGVTLHAAGGHHPSRIRRVYARRTTTPWARVTTAATTSSRLSAAGGTLSTR